MKRILLLTATEPGGTRSHQLAPHRFSQEREMTPENEMPSPPTAERVSRELSRWFDHRELADPPEGNPRYRGMPAGAIDWVRVAAFPGDARRVPRRDLGGLSWVALAVTLALYVHSHVRHYRLLSSLFLAPHLQDLPCRAVHLRLAGRLGRAAGTDLVGRPSPPSSRAFRQAARMYIPRGSMAFFGATWAGSCRTSTSAPTSPASKTCSSIRSCAFSTASTSPCRRCSA